LDPNGLGCGLFDPGACATDLLNAAEEGSERVGNVVAGAADTITAGYSTKLLDAIGIEPDTCSVEFQAGNILGYAGIVIPGVGEEELASNVAELGARNLGEQLTLGEATAGAGSRIMKGKIKDALYPENEWAKIQHTHSYPDGGKTVIHYWENLLTGDREGFKVIR
jgi:hypothetical protein